MDFFIENRGFSAHGLLYSVALMGFESAFPVTPESIAQVRQEIARNQAQLDFMQAVASTARTQPVAQLSMFGESIPAKTERRKRR